MLNVIKVNILSERTSGVPPVIFFLLLGVQNQIFIPIQSIVVVVKIGLKTVFFLGEKCNFWLTNLF